MLSVVCLLRRWVGRGVPFFTCFALSTGRSYSTQGRRVVVTGLGIVCPLGSGAHIVWPRLIEGHCGISRVQGPGYEKIPSQVAGYVPRGTAEGEFDAAKFVSSSERRTMADASVFALGAAAEALQQADWTPLAEEERARTGVAVGMGMVGLEDIVQTGITLQNQGYRKVSPYFVPRILTNMAAGHISMRYKFKGPNHAVSTACTTGCHAIGDAARLIRNGDADIMIAGGAEASNSPIAMAGFARARALSTHFNEEPTLASRPFDKDRDGFVMSEGSALLVLEELGHARSRKIPILAEICGYGLSGDANHMTAPSEDGEGAERCMRAALKDAGIPAGEVSYINAHATSTPLGDVAEASAIQRLFGDRAHRVAVSSTKGATGHLLGAAGSLEAAFTVLACQTGTLPPTVNLVEATAGAGLDHVPRAGRPWSLHQSLRRRVALTNSFGFGGTNATLCIAEYIP